MVMEQFKRAVRELWIAPTLLKERIKWYILALIAANEEYYKEKEGAKKMEDRKNIRYFKLIEVRDIPLLKMFDRINSITVKEIERDTAEIFGYESKLAQEFTTKFGLVLMDIRNQHWLVVEGIVEVMFRNGKYPPQYSLAVLDALSTKASFHIEYDSTDKAYWLSEKRYPCGQEKCPCDKEEECKMNSFSDAILSRPKETMPRA